MKHIGIAKPDTLVTILNWIGILLFSGYIFGMLVYPFFFGSGGWSHIHDVWHSWQALNVGVLAFLSSIVALNISRYHVSKQRERDFVAARAFLPEALSELNAYFKLCALLLSEAWSKAKEKSTKTPLVIQLPALPKSYKEVFSRCIAVAEPDVGEHLAYILMRLQIHNSRINELYNNFREDSTMMVTPANIISYLYGLAELQAFVGRTYGFARGLEPLDNSSLEWEDYYNAYMNLGILVDHFDDLAGFTQRVINNNNEDNNT